MYASFTSVLDWQNNVHALRSVDLAICGDVVLSGEVHVMCAGTGDSEGQAGRD